MVTDGGNQEQKGVTYGMQHHPGFINGQGKDPTATGRLLHEDTQPDMRAVLSEKPTIPMPVASSQDTQPVPTVPLPAVKKHTVGSGNPLTLPSKQK